jgi:hypothetical protein
MATVSVFMIGKMIPGPALPYLEYACHIYAELGRKVFGFHRPSGSVDMEYLSLGQFGIAIVRAASGIVSAFLRLIAHIVLMSANKQMVRVAAWRIVAFMTDEQSVRNCAMNGLPCKAMRANGSAIIYPDESVAASVCRPRPVPAFGDSFNLDVFPESFRRPLLVTLIARARAVSTLVDVMNVNLKKLMAVDAVYIELHKDIIA